MVTDQDVTAPALVACIGLDWGDERHAVHLQAADGGPVERVELEQKPDVLHAWVAQLRERFHGRPVGIAIEQRKGAVIHALMMYEFFVLYPVNPKALARYRQTFRTSGAKDDPADAELLLDLLRKHRDQLRPWLPDTVEARTLQSLCEQQHNCRKAGVIDARIRQIASACPLTSDPAIVDPLSLSVQTYATQLRVVIEAVQAFDTRIADVFAHHPDQALFDSFPGAGPVCAPRLAAAFGTDRSRWQSATELQSHSGIAPVTERSGKALWIHHRLACPKFVKQTFHEFADQSIRFSQWARAYYDQQRGRGNDHHAALRALAYKWIRILFRCWKDRKRYDEATYMDALRRHGSSLVKNNA